MVDRKAFRDLSYGLYIITAVDGDRKVGCVVNTFNQVTSSPARVSVAINKDNFTTGIVLASGRFEASVLAESAPMTYAYYHEVKGGKTPAKASSYTPDEPVAPAPDPQAAPATRIGWKCKICGYVIEVDELPEDFQCPICKQGREMFERIEITE